MLLKGNTVAVAASWQDRGLSEDRYLKKMSSKSILIDAETNTPDLRVIQAETRWTVYCLV